MFTERALFRLHHPVPPIPELVAAPDGKPNERLAGRVISAFKHVDQVLHAGPLWEHLLREKQASLGMWLNNADARALASDISALGRSEAAQGFFGGAGQHRKCAADPAFARLLAVWTYDKLLSLAEALGVVHLELPETGRWRESIQHSPTELWTRIERKLGMDLTPPNHIGGYLGIEASGQIIQMRIVEAIYAAYRLRQLAETSGSSSRICEIGAGAGLTAYYAILMGAQSYTIIDLPTMNAIQGYVLAGSKLSEKVALSGDPTCDKPVRILPPEGFAKLPIDSFDILYNQDSFPEIEVNTALQYLRDAMKLRIPLFLSINQEAHLTTESDLQRSVPELVAQSESYRAISRHRHWLRQGYLEEVYTLCR